MERDPYEVIGVSPSATDDEVKQAYRQLAKKYHPDRYVDSPLADTAAEKMKEINDAYDRILDERKRAKESGSNNYQAYHAASTRFAQVRQLLNANRFDEAESLLNSCPSDERNAEWYYLKGFVLYRRGWLEDAYNHFRTACDKDPQNAEYRAAFDRVQKQRSGAVGGYNPQQGQTCTVCDICNALVCMDCLCNCCMR